MRIKDQLTLAAGFAVLMASTSLFRLFDGNRWVAPVAGAVLTVVVSGLLMRRLRLPPLLQPPLQVALLAGYELVEFASAGHPWTSIRVLVHQGHHDINVYAAPIPTTQGLLLMTSVAVGLLAILVDLLAAVLDRAAVAGLPLLVLLAVPAAVVSKGVGGLPFLLGAIGWMALLLVEGSERVGRWGLPLPGDTTVRQDSSIGRVGGRIGVAALGLALVVPILVPGLKAHSFVAGRGSGTGVLQISQPVKGPENLNPFVSLRSELSEPTPRELFSYTSNAPDYLRLTTLDTYAGGSWTQSRPLVADRVNGEVSTGIARQSTQPYTRVTTDVTVTKGGDLRSSNLPVPLDPIRVAVSSGWFWDADTGTVFSPKHVVADLRHYTVTSAEPVLSATLLADSQPEDVPAEIARDDTAVPAVPPVVNTLVTQLASGQATQFQMALAIQRFFTNPANGFVYDLTPSTGVPGEDPLVAFLQGRHGFCQQYATAMAVMLRLAGIPSRVAIGFTPGTAVREGSHTLYDVTTANAHAWPEAWFQGVGWVRFEPTPPASGSTQPSYVLNSDPTAQTPPPSSPTPLPRPATSPTPASPRSSATPAIATHRNPQDPLTALPAGGGSSPWRSPWLYLPLIGAVVLALPGLLTLVRRRRRLARPGALTGWDQLVDDATDIGHTWHEADSPRAGAARLLTTGRVPPGAAEALVRLASAAERARYARASEGVGLLDQRADLATVRTALHKQASRRVRLRALLYPPSTLHWLSEGIADATRTLLERVDDLFAAVTAPIRRRATE